MARVKDTKYVNPQEVYNYLVSEKGLSREHALGMLANIQAESGFNVSIQEGGKATGTGGIGLFQHTGPRRSALMKYTGGDIADWKKQVDFALQESPSKSYLSKTFSTPEEASTWFTTEWERPANASAQAKARLSNINKFSNFTQYESTGNDGIATGERKFQVMLGDTPTYISLEDFNKELEKAKKAEEKTTQSKDRQEVEEAKTKEQSFLEALNTMYSNTSQNTNQTATEDQQMGTEGGGYEPLDVPKTQSSLPAMPSLFSTEIPQMADGGPVYTYAGRPGSYYQKTGDGKWMVSNSGTGGQYVSVQDPTGERTAALNKGATIIMANPTSNNYENLVPSYSKSPMVQSIIGDTQAERQQVNNDIAYQDLISKSRQTFNAQKEAGLPQNEQPLESQDWMWSLLGAPTGIKTLNSLSAVQIPYLGMSIGRVAGLAGGAHFIKQAPELKNEWQDVYTGKKDWRDAAVDSFIPALEALGGISELGNLALAAKARYSAIPGELQALDATQMIDLARPAAVVSQQAKQPLWIKSGDVSTNLGLFKPGRYAEDVAFAQKREIAKVQSTLYPEQNISLRGTMVGEEPAYYFNANMPNSVEAGRALNALAAEIPKGGIIVEPNSLSMDSWTALLKRGTDSKKFTAFPGGYVPLNNSAVHNILPNQSKALQLDSPVMSFENIDDAKEAAKFINSKLPSKFKTLKTKVVYNEYGDGYQIQVPTLKLRKEYKQGGKLNGTFWFL